MSMATRVQEHLLHHSVFYDLRRHAYCENSLRTAQLARIPPQQLAKAVLAEDEQGQRVLAVIPADRRLSLLHLSRALKRRFHLANETCLGDIFDDCVSGAVPALGAAYQLLTVVDDALLRQETVFFEAGDHHALVQLSGKQFRSLLAEAEHGYFSSPAPAEWSIGDRV
jgi:Ala-tRNA(Pro) deacylase